MSIIANKPATPPRLEPRSRDGAADQRRLGEGQRALGHREPLNPTERMKRRDDRINARLRVEPVYTRRTLPGEDPRAGRWPMFGQTKYGLPAA